MSAHWHVGMKVVCIKRGRWSNDSDGTSKPIYGGVYTIREVYVGAGVGPCIRLVEIVNPELMYREGLSECGFVASRFRPVQKRKTSIAVFQRLLLNPFVKIGEDA